MVANQVMLFKSLGDELRLDIIRYLLRDKQCTCICELAKKFNRDQSVIYRHIMLLQKANVVATHKDGNFLMCCIKDRKRVENLLKV